MVFLARTQKNDSLQKYFFKVFKKILKQDENRFLGQHETGFEEPKNMYSVGV